MNELSSVAAPATPVPLPPAQVAFTGDRGEFRRLVTRGAGLELVTFGFYRFWLLTDIRRHLWLNTSVDGDAAEYTGRGKELLVGFLFALAILAPLYFVYFLVSIEAERYQAFASIPLFVILYAFGQFAIYRARRYRLTRTVWRGVRFWMDGSGWAYSLRAMLWGLLVLLTLGLAVPWRDAALERYKMRHSYYGELQGDFEGTGWEYFKRAWWLWPVCVAAVIVYAVATMYSLHGARFNPELRVAVLVRQGLAAIIVLPLAPFLYAQFRARQWRWWLSGIRIGGVRLESTLSHRAFYGLYWKVIGWFLLMFIVYGIILVVGAAVIVVLVGRTAAINPDGTLGIPLMVVMVAGYIAFMLAFNIVTRIYLLRDIWGKVLKSTEVRGIEAAANVQAKGELAGALGEGFADGLDVAGF